MPSRVESNRSGFHAICRLDDLQDGRCSAFRFARHSLLLCRSGPDVFAIENRCSHLSKPLEGGRLIGSRLVCPFHGAAFDIRSGRALSGPAVEPIAAFAVDVRDEVIFVSREPVVWMA